MLGALAIGKSKNFNWIASAESFAHRSDWRIIQQ
jgi:hypothetical protein